MITGSDIDSAIGRKRAYLELSEEAIQRITDELGMIQDYITIGNWYWALRTVNALADDTNVLERLLIDIGEDQRLLDKISTEV